MPTIAAIPSKTAQERQFLIALKTVLDRAYQDGIDQFYNWKIDGNSISGVFRDGEQGYKFTLNEKGLIYNPVGKNRRDSEIEGATLSNSAMRLDGPKRRKCKGDTTYACGGTCLPNVKVCRINSRHVANPGELRTLVSLGNSLRKPLVPEQAFEAFEKPIVDLSSKPKGPKKELDQMSIRELRDEAQTRGVPGYSHVNKDTLKAMIVAWDKEPEDQRRIVKVIEKRKKERDADPFTEFKRFFGLKKVLGPGSAITAALILKVGLHSYNKVKDRYQGNFSTSAEVARQRMNDIAVPTISDSKNFITFTVDRQGKQNTGTLEKSLMEADPKFFKKHQIVSVGSDAFEDPPSEAEKNAKPPKEVAPAFETYAASASRLSSQMIRGRDPQAIELAAQVLAFNKKYPDKQINLMGDHDGGMVVNEAAEIIRRANKQLAPNLRIVNLGTPDFGLTEQVTSMKNDNDGRTITLSAKTDGLNLFPRLNNYQVDSVKGGHAKDYLGNKHALEVVRGAFGYYGDLNSVNRHDPNDPYHPRNQEGFDNLTPEERKKKLYDYRLAKIKEEADTPGNRQKREADKAAQEELERHERYLKRKKLGPYASPDDDDDDGGPPPKPSKPPNNPPPPDDDDDDGGPPPKPPNNPPPPAAPPKPPKTPKPSAPPSSPTIVEPKPEKPIEVKEPTKEPPGEPIEAPEGLDTPKSKTKRKNHVNPLSTRVSDIPPNRPERKRGDSLDNQSPAYRQAFLQTARRFRGRV